MNPDSDILGSQGFLVSLSGARRGKKQFTINQKILFIDVQTWGNTKFENKSNKQE